VVGADDFYFAAAAQDSQQNLWMTTYGAGAWRYDGHKITRFPVKVGAKEAHILCIYKDNRGDLWLGTDDAGAYRFDGRAFERFRW
jgi:ligand-binding sensor domain-containing protein